MFYSVPAIQYRQGARVMYTLVMDPGSLAQMVEPPTTWNPVGGRPRGNRPQDRAHRVGIAEYLENEPDPILGAAVLYVESDDIADFVPFAGQSEALPIVVGTLQVRMSARYSVGDGQHRIGALSDVLTAHEDADDPVAQRLSRMGLPIVLVVDDDGARMAQDFADLQRNVKPPTTSLGASMDRRQPINLFTLELSRREDLSLLYERVEFLKDSPGKLSAKIVSFKTLRYMIGTLLIGTAERSSRGWEVAANAAVDGPDHDQVQEDVVGFFRGLSEVEPFSMIVGGEHTVAEVRAATLAMSSSVLYAIALAVQRVEARTGDSYEEVAKSLSMVNFDRPDRDPSEDDPLTEDDTFFAGTIVDRETGKLSAGRDAWETAAARLEERILGAAEREDEDLEPSAA